MADYAERHYSVMNSAAEATEALRRVTEDMAVETAWAQRWAFRVAVFTALGAVMLGAVATPPASRWLSHDNPVSYVVCTARSGAVVALEPDGGACPRGPQTPP
jgi:hypothetical protein